MLRPALVIAASLMLSTPLHAAEPAAQPWTETFPVTLAGKERVFAVVDGEPYLVATRADIRKPDNAATDVVSLVKVRRKGGQLGLYALDTVVVEGDPEVWAGRLDGDNVWILARLESGEGKPRLTIRRLLDAPTDGQRLAERGRGLAATDWTGRLEVAAWARRNAVDEGNPEYWQVQAETLISAVIDDAVKDAEARKDLTLTGQAMDWSIQLLKDAGRAARIGSALWLRDAGAGYEAISKRLRRLAFDTYNGQWLPRAEAAKREFEDRFAAMDWRNAEGYYQLGRWCDQRAEDLPQSKDRAWRAFQAGFKADPKHPGIRRELGLTVEAADVVADPAAATAKNVTDDIVDALSGTIIPAPQGWKRNDAGGDPTFVDPASETVTISVRLTASGAALGDVWQELIQTWQVRDGFQGDPEVDTVADTHGLRRQRVRYLDGASQRRAILAAWRSTTGPRAVLITAKGEESDLDRLDEVISNLVGAIRVEPPAVVDPAVPPTP